MTPASEAASHERPPGRLLFWQVLTVVLMVLGYSGYYLCRSNLSVTLPMIAAELKANGMAADIARIRLGTIASLGILAYAIGKFPSGAIADFFGGRRNFLTGMAGSILFTVLFALGGGIPIFTLAWIGNRLIQSMGWAGMVKVTSKWFSFSSYGTAMGIVSLSYLFGDAAAREFMARLIGAGFGWRTIFFISAGVLAVLFLLNAVMLRESPRDLGLHEPKVSPHNLFGEEGDKPKPSSLKALLAPLLRSKIFWLVCLLSLGLTLVRETFNLWTPTYFIEVVGLEKADAAHKSALFQLVGGISVILTGFLSDKLGRAGRAATIFVGLLLTGGVLLALGSATFQSSLVWPVILVSSVAFFVIGPYAYLAGAISLDFGGKQGSATASGIIDGVGYLGGVLAGDSVARISVAYGWQGAFTVLAVGTWLAAIAAAVYLIDQIRAVRAG